MAPDPDELAGVVDLFGGLTREELRRAYADLAARSGDPFDAEALDATVDGALERYYLIDVTFDGAEDGEGGTQVGETDGALLVAGPASLPRLPEGGEDLPHLVDVAPRSVDPGLVGETALARLRGDAARAVDEEDDERIATLLDVCYDLEAWAPVETAELRDRLDAAR